MGYSDQPFNQRIHSLGDAAEAVFLEVAPLGSAERLGWNRPSVSMSLMDPMLRHLPDYYTGTGWLVECMGCGQDRTVKLKLVKYDALLAWNKVQRLALFINNSADREWVLASMEGVKRAVGRARRAGRIDAFSNDGNEFYGIPFSDLRDDPDSVGGQL